MHLKRRVFIAGGAAMAAAPVLAQPQAPAAPPVTVPAPTLPPPEPGMVRVNIKTGEGLIVLDLHAEKAPLTSANFLRYVDQKRYDGANFYRATRPPEVTDYGVIQGGLQNNPAKILKPVAHEPTSQTGVKHTDMAISMARNKPGTATSDFFICVGDQPYLDADPTQPGDNLGFAAFGKVVGGRDVVLKILNLPTGGKARNPVMQGQILTTPVPIVSMRRAG